MHCLSDWCNRNRQMAGYQSEGGVVGGVATRPNRSHLPRIEPRLRVGCLWRFRPGLHQPREHAVILKTATLASRSWLDSADPVLVTSVACAATS